MRRIFASTINFQSRANLSQRRRWSPTRFAKGSVRFANSLSHFRRPMELPIHAHLVDPIGDNFTMSRHYAARFDGEVTSSMGGLKCDPNGFDRSVKTAIPLLASEVAHGEIANVPIKVGSRIFTKEVSCSGRVALDARTGLPVLLLGIPQLFHHFLPERTRIEPYSNSQWHPKTK